MSNYGFLQDDAHNDETSTGYTETVECSCGGDIVFSHTRKQTKIDGVYFNTDTEVYRCKKCKKIYT